MEFENLKIGMKESISKTITETDIILYSGISLDCNPIHLNKTYAETSRFKKRIAHGMLTAGLVSAILGTRLPGEGTIYLEQTLKFKQPVYLGDTITAVCEIIDIIEEQRKIILSTICTNQDGKVVLTGEAKVMK